MKVLLLPLILLLLLLGPAEARLYATKAQLIERYGEPVAEIQEKGRMVFQLREFMVLAELGSSDRVQLLVVWKPGKQGQPEALGEIQIQEILKANAGGKVWRQVEAPGNAQDWARDDGAIAFYDREIESLFLISSAGVSQAKEDIRQSVRGF